VDYYYLKNALERGMLKLGFAYRGYMGNAYIGMLVAIGPGQICVSRKRTKISNKDFPRGQVNGSADNLNLRKLKHGTE